MASHARDDDLGGIFIVVSKLVGLQKSSLSEEKKSRYRLDTVHVTAALSGNGDRDLLFPCPSQLCFIFLFNKKGDW